MPRNRAFVPLLVARGNPLTAKLAALLPLNGIKRDLITSGALSVTGDKFKPSARGGLSLRGDGATVASIPLDLSAYTKVTLSFWLYWDAFANNDALAFELGNPTSVSNGFHVDPNSSTAPGQFEVTLGGPGGYGGKAFARPTALQWHHYIVGFDKALVGGVQYVYVDGVGQALTAVVSNTPGGTFPAASTLNLMSRSGSTLFGAGNLQDLAIFNGLLSESEVVSLYQRPDQLYRAPAPQPRLFGVTAAGGPDILNARRRLMGAMYRYFFQHEATDPYFSSVVLLLHGEGANSSTTFTDHSSYAKTVSVTGSTAVDTSSAKFGTGSIKGAVSSYLTASLGTEGSLTGDFTIEMFTQGGAASVLFYGNGGAYLYNNVFQGYGGANLAISTADGSPGDWNHYALTRSGSTVRGFRNGTLTDTQTYSGTVDLSTLYLGYYVPGNNLHFTGNYDEIRVTKGVARYTSAFTPPTVAFSDS